jgi:hypothetical protein
MATITDVPAAAATGIHHQRVLGPDSVTIEFEAGRAGDARRRSGTARLSQGLVGKMKAAAPHDGQVTTWCRRPRSPVTIWPHEQLTAKGPPGARPGGSACHHRRTRPSNDKGSPSAKTLPHRLDD